MVEEQRKRVEDHMTRLVEELDKSHIRRMQADMHRCATTCCENDSYSMERVHSCISKCGNTLNKAQQYVEKEFERVQNRLQRCVMECNDKILDKMGPYPPQSDVDKYRDEFELCSTKCVDAHCESLPALEKTMKKVLASKKFDE
ncbi:hypothetical protein KM043_011942 [Ampulex compressa]|nr:hypothetical protein KM043_011942 [Ampulex compressa]